MPRPFDLLGAMSDADLVWLCEVGARQTYGPGDTLIHAERPLDRLIILLRGEVEIGLPDGLTIARAGPGDILGEMSLVEETAPSVAVRAVADVAALEAPQAKIAARMSVDAAFSARLHKALAIFLSSRLRAQGQRLMYGLDADEPGTATAPKPVDMDRLRRLEAILAES